MSFIDSFYVDHVCKWRLCKKEFRNKSRTIEFCSPDCKKAYWKERRETLKRKNESKRVVEVTK